MGNLEISHLNTRNKILYSRTLRIESIFVTFKLHDWLKLLDLVELDISTRPLQLKYEAFDIRFCFWHSPSFDIGFSTTYVKLAVFGSSPSSNWRKLRVSTSWRPSDIENWWSLFAPKALVKILVVCWLVPMCRRSMSPTNMCSLI